MVARRRVGQESSDASTRKLRPATTPQARENQLIAAAYDLAERQIREGTASSQVIVQFLRLGSSREKLEQERIAIENNVSQAKIEMMQSAKRVEEMYGQALEAMRSYAGQAPLEIEMDYDD